TSYAARVDSPDPTSVVLRTTYHPSWEATLHGGPARTFMVLPSYIGIDVPAGSHRVEFQYRPPGYRVPLFFAGFALLLVLGMVHGHLPRLTEPASTEALVPSTGFITRRWTAVRLRIVAA